jgi:3-hydroxyacyl-[acyl-carrier-protein] dehydratase
MKMQFRFAVAKEHPSLPGHFPGRPIAPGVLLLGHVLSNVAREMKRPVQILQQVRFAAALLPGEIAVADVNVAGQEARFFVRVERVGALVTVASGSLRLADPVSSQLATDPP